MTKKWDILYDVRYKNLTDKGINLKGNPLKFQQLEAFEKHLNEAFPDHLSKIYFVICADPFERRSMVDMVGGMLQKKGECHVKNCRSLNDALGHLNHGSLFSGCNLAIVDALEPAALRETSEMEKYLLHPAGSSYLIFADSSAKLLHDLYLKGKKEVVMLDLSSEKPWARKQRLKASLGQFAKKQGKNLPVQALEFLLENLPLDLSLIQQEIIKLTAYVGDKREISLADIQHISCLSKTLSGWQVAEELVWNRGSLTKTHFESSELFLLIGQIRYHLELGLKLSSLLHRSVPLDDLRSQFPEIKPLLFEKYLSTCQKEKMHFFKRGLLFLYEFEFAMKNSAGSPILLFERFRAKLLQLEEPCEWNSTTSSQSVRRGVLS